MRGDRVVAERLAAAAREAVPLPYPMAEAVDVVDGALIGAAALFDDPAWLADVWLADDEPAGGVAR